MSKQTETVDPLTLPDDKAREKAGFRLHYGVWWPPVGKRPTAEIEAAIELFRLPKAERPKNCPKRYELLKAIIDLIWNNPASTQKYDHHPWSERILEACCSHKEVAIAGCASSGKSRALAAYAVISFIADPSNTKVLVTSTSLKASYERVWGDIEKFWRAAIQVVGSDNLPGKLVSSAGMIVRKDPNGGFDKTRGISLIAGEASKAAEAQTKMQGVKAKKLILIADELAELSENIISTAESNLRANEFFQLVSAANPKSYYDAFAKTAEPESGWDSINETMDGWKTKRGICIRLDGERSPNILAGKTIYPYLMTQEKLDDYRLRLGEKSMRYYQMVRGWWSPTGALDAIYSESDIIRMKADKPAVWAEPPTNVAGFDPSFTNGGDRSVCYFGKFGVTTDGLKTLEFTDYVELHDDATDKTTGRNFRIAQKIIDECTRRKVSPRHVAVDGTGAGKPFCDILRSLWSGEILEINFASSASELPASGTDDTPSKDRYVNMVSELWFVGREYVQSGQIRGMKPDLIKELCARTYQIKERGKVRVEPKPEMKGRTGFSPDVGDSACLALAVCRHRLGFGSKLRSKSSADPKRPNRNPWKLTANSQSKYRQKAQKMVLARKY